MIDVFGNRQNLHTDWESESYCGELLGESSCTRGAMRLHELTNGIHKQSRKDAREYQYLKVALTTKRLHWRLGRNCQREQENQEGGVPQEDRESG